MFIGLSYDGRIFSTDAEHSRKVEDGLWLDDFNQLVVELPGSATFVTHYDHDYQSCIHGKIRLIGNVLVTYYDSDYESCLQGKVRYLGPKLITYYDSDYESCLKGKVRSVGNTHISYFDSDSSRPGKVRYVGDLYLG